MTLADQERRPIPGPETPVSLAIDPETLVTLRQLQRDYGDAVQVTTKTGRTAIFLNEADDVRRLLVRNHSRYRKGPGFERVKMLLGNGLIVSDGDVWRRSRRMIQPAFSRQNINGLIDIMVECAERRAGLWDAVAGAGGELAITQEMNEFALELILRCMFGDDYFTLNADDGDHPFAFLSKDSARDLRIVMQVRESREILSELIEQRRARGDENQFDFLSMYMRAVDKEGMPYSDDELLDELITLMVAGYETSAGTLNWAWYLLATHAQIETELLREARTILGDNSSIDHETLGAMHYTQQVLEETLRLYPPVWLYTRKALEDDKLTHIDVPAGADIYLSPFILQRSERYWPNPEQFDPGRFAVEGGLYKKGGASLFSVFAGSTQVSWRVLFVSGDESASRLAHSEV